jgi:hypothetical protein
MSRPEHITARIPKRRSINPVAASGPRALRVGLLQGGRIIEERIVRDRASVSVGQSERSTILVAHPRLPGRFTLFESRQGSYWLNVEPYMTGRVMGPGGVVDLGATAPGRIALDDQSRGKITIGDATLLFQFVIPPPVQPRPQLPAAVRGAWMKAAFALFLAAEGFIGWVWAASLLCSIGFVGFFHLHDWPIEEEGIAVDNIYQELLVTPPAQYEDRQAEVDRAAPDGDGENADEAGDEPQADDQDRTDRKSVDARPRVALSDEQKAAANRARLEAAVNDTALLIALGSMGGNNPAGGADMLRGSKESFDIDDVLAKVTQFKTGSTADTASSLGGVSNSGNDATAADIDGPAAGVATVGVVTTGPVKEKDVLAIAHADKGEEVGGTGISDPASVNKTVKKNMSALKNCYEKALKKNENLEGKISVKFVISTNGRVTSVDATKDSMGDAGVTACVLDKFKGFTFEKPEGGSVTYVFPLVFKAAK